MAEGAAVSVRENLEKVKARMVAAEARAGRPAGSVRLVAVSKTQPMEKIRAAYEAGQRLFGENYAQELRDKAEALKDLPDLALHFIGTLQKNKAKYVVPVAAMFEALDDLGLARELDKRAAAASRILPVLVEVNLGEEQKGGVRPDDLAGFLAALRGLPSMRVEGLMCIPPPCEDPESTRPFFRKVALLGREHGLGALSMGMSSDFEVAIEEGATLVRVGTAIFGERSYPAR
ncbi:MAG: YggS family pyridoxal phosphate-dependent enzyme [Deltaproteobacteria bacterium]|nr:YggS family pyridoxal phosphate-dependent enzyme [Deltaproteobacteria bacterium]